MLEAGIVTLFPQLFESFLSTSLIGRACETGQLRATVANLRDHGLGKHRAVDDTPYGGGAGMLLRVDCVVSAVESLSGQMTRPPHRVLLTPQGTRFSQATARRWSQLPSLLLVCGRYEGFDERIRDFVDEEVSLGDFVMIGGEVAAMAMLEACVRLLPGVLGNHTSAVEESFSFPSPSGEASATGQRLEYPQYTRPVEFRGLGVPDVLKSGHHGEISSWRDEASKLRTRQRRPDLCQPLKKGTQ